MEKELDLVGSEIEMEKDLVGSEARLEMRSEARPRRNRGEIEAGSGAMPEAKPLRTLLASL